MSIVPHLPLPASPIGDRADLAFTGRSEDFSRLLLRGVLLALPTFGFHRFWLITSLRRHLWANTRIGADAFEYTGTARELLLGFLTAVAILAPLNVAYVALGFVAETWAAFASVPLVAVFYVFGQYAAFRARRYRATRTTFRGLRFWMDGSGWSYAGRASFWDVLTLLTLGLAYPWRTAALERYKMRHTRYGDVGGDFVGTGWALFARGWWMWAIAAGGAALALYGAGRAYAGSEAPAALVIGGLLLLTLPFLYPVFLAVQTRWHLEGLRFGPVALRTELRKGAVYACYLRLALASMMLSTAASIVLGILLAGGGSLESLAADAATAASVLALAAVAAGYLLLMLAFGALQRHFVLRGLWLAVAATTTATGFLAVDDVLAAGDAASPVGEGLADALDMGAF